MLFSRGDSGSYPRAGPDTETTLLPALHIQAHSQRPEEEEQTITAIKTLHFLPGRNTRSQTQPALSAGTPHCHILAHVLHIPESRNVFLPFLRDEPHVGASHPSLGAKAAASPIFPKHTPSRSHCSTSGTSTPHPAGEERLGPPSSSFISWVSTHNPVALSVNRFAWPLCAAHPAPGLSSKAHPQALGWCIKQ